MEITIDQKEELLRLVLAAMMVLEDKGIVTKEEVSKKLDELDNDYEEV